MTQPGSAKVLLLSLGLLIAWVDRTNLSIALASPAFREAFQLTDTQRGALGSAFFLSYALLQWPAGAATDRWGVRWPYAISFALWSLVSAATAFVTTFEQLIALRLLLGAGEAIVTPASMRWIATHIAEPRRGLAVGLLFMGAKLGPALGTWLAVELMGTHGWRGMFLILGLGSLVFLIPWLLLIRDPAQATAHVEPTATAGIPWRSRNLWGLLPGTLAYNYFNYFCLTWMPAFLTEHWHLTLGEMRIVNTTGFLGTALTAVAAGALADRIIRRGHRAAPVRLRFTVAGLALAALSALSIHLDRAIGLPLVVLSMTGLGLTTANYWALTQTLMPGATIGRISGLQNFAANAAGIAAPAVTGYLVQQTGGYTAALWAMLGVLVVGIASYFLILNLDPKVTP